MKKNLFSLRPLLVIVMILSFALSYPAAILAQSINTLTTTTTQTSTGFTPTYANTRWSEDTLRSHFGQYGITENSNVTFYGLGNFGITGLVALKWMVDYYTYNVRGSTVPLSKIVVTAGTETYGSDTPVLDVQSDPALNYFITTLATSRGNSLYQLGDDYMFQTSTGWHIIFGPSNGAFVKNIIPFFGIVRDNFNVAHPMINSGNIPSTIAFNRNLNLGSSGKDVHDLQQLLNTDPYTQVAQNGPGSPGQESTYFGAKTLAAVKAYQFKNNEILDAAGITVATGIAASFTRASLSAYWNYLNTILKGNGNSSALQYPTPTKPLQDIPANGVVPSASAGTTVSATNNVPIGVNNTPNAPTYSGSINNLPVQGADNTDQLNSTPVFEQPPDVNGYNVTDPNNAANNSTNASQPSQNSGLLQSVLQIATLFLLRSGGSGIGGLGGNTSGASHATGFTDFGGNTIYNSNVIPGPGDKYRPCGCSAVSFVVNSNTAYPGPKPVYLLDVGTTLIPGTCSVGKYNPAGAAGLCMSWYKIGQQDVCQVGTGQEPPYAGVQPMGLVTIKKACSSN